MLLNKGINNHPYMILKQQKKNFKVKTLAQTKVQKVE